MTAVYQIDVMYAHILKTFVMPCKLTGGNKSASVKCGNLVVLAEYAF